MTLEQLPNSEQGLSQSLQEQAEKKKGLPTLIAKKIESLAEKLLTYGPTGAHFHGKTPPPNMGDE